MSVNPVWLPVLLLCQLLLFSTVAGAVCTAHIGMREDVLIVVNANSTSAGQIGDYYCEQRGIDPANIASVYVPTVNDVKLDQFVSLRDQLILFLQQHTLNGNEAPVVCDIAQGYTRYYCPEIVDQVRRLTRIRYLVLIRGMPNHFYFTGSPLPNTTITSVDNYLRFWLLNYLAQDTSFSSFNPRAADFADGRGMRIVQPDLDREFIVGRIDGITPQNAMQLIDRTVAAERAGIYGKLVSSMFTSMYVRLNNNGAGAYWKEWLTGRGVTTVYPSWHYLHGLFGALQLPSGTAVTHVTDPLCVINDPVTQVLPQDCVTRLTGIYPNGGNNVGPGMYGSVIPRPDQTLVYQGQFGGFSSVGNFQSLLNWRDTANCNTLCAAGDAACKAASVDNYKEIDTRCVRVADGFIGYNFGSYPAGIMYGSPTGWFVSIARGSNVWDQNSNGGTSFRAPKVRDDMGYDDTNSLWFDLPEQVPGATCYTSGDDVQQAPAAACDSADRILIDQIVPIAEQAVNTASPQVITVRFKYRALNLDRAMPLQVHLFVHESQYSDSSITIPYLNEVDYKDQTAASLAAPDTPADGTSWGNGVASFTLDPSMHLHPQLLFDQLKIWISSGGNAFQGQVAIDTVSMDIDGLSVPLQNASFADGFRQLSGGDSAATFLGRLNGVAFWANLTHHSFENGRSFDTHPYETLIYFLRGLPLGDAVWFAEAGNAGILYGDPLYSPIAVHLHYLTNSTSGAPQDTFERQTPLALRGDTVNGTGSDVTTTYSVSYCGGKDFFVCDQGQTWVPVANLQNQPGGSHDMALGNWDASALAAGDYILRLAVTSTNATSGKEQTFNDYYPLLLQDAPEALSRGAHSSSDGVSGGSGGTSGGGDGGGCTVTDGNAGSRVDPVLPLLLLSAGLALGRGCRRTATAVYS
jgi:hypothetical protein